MIHTSFNVLRRASILALAATSLSVAGCGGSDTPAAPPPAPTVTAVTPASGVVGTTVNVTITGTGFTTTGNTVVVSGSGVAAASPQVASATSLTTSLVIAANADLGTRQITVQNANGTSQGVAFTVNAGTPTLTTISPNSGFQGATTSVTLTGTNFVTGQTSIAVSGSNVQVTNVTVVNATTVTAQLLVDATAAAGARNVTVTTPGGTTAAQVFTVKAPAPTLTGLSVTGSPAGNTVNEELTGTNFTAGSTVQVSGTGVTVNNVQFQNSTSILAQFVVAAGAAAGPRNVTVTTAGGTTGTVTFTVIPPPPTLGTITPAVGAQGTTQTLTFKGSNYVAGATSVTVDTTGGVGGVTISNVTVVDANTLTASVTIDAAATLGSRSFRITTAGGSAGGAPFTVVSSVPTLSSISPTTGDIGSAVTVTLTGTAFIAGGTTVLVDGSGVFISNVTVNSQTSLTAVFTMSNAALAGPRNVTVTTAGGTSGAVTFTVTTP